MENILDVQSLSLDRGGKPVLKKVSFQVKKHSVMMVIGPSGAGKSTLLRTINRLLEPPEESIFYEGVDITSIPVLQLRLRIGMVFQKPAMFQGTVGDNVSYGVHINNRELDKDQIAELLQAVSLDPQMVDEDAQRLSGGQAQRVALARTLAIEPEVLLLDEPTSSLDPHATRQVEKTLLNLNNERGLTLLWVSHAIEQTRRIGGKVLLLREGKALDCGPVETVLDPEGFHRDALAFAAGEDINQDK
jgi:ABC-type methionine transport system ATPase subunit